MCLYVAGGVTAVKWSGPGKGWGRRSRGGVVLCEVIREGFLRKMSFEATSRTRRSKPQRSLGKECSRRREGQVQTRSEGEGRDVGVGYVSQATAAQSADGVAVEWSQRFWPMSQPNQSCRLLWQERIEEEHVAFEERKERTDIHVEKLSRDWM